MRCRLDVTSRRGSSLPDTLSQSGRGDREREEGSTPAGRTGRRRELGWATTFLASPYASYIAGP
jgi:hypothetical protein